MKGCACNMSYEIDYITHECPCPCGKGKIIYGDGSNDWNQTKEGMTEIACGACYEKYKFTNGGLLPKDYPEYQGDKDAYEIMRQLGYIISNYCGDMGYQFWSDDLRKSRLQKYLTPEEAADKRIMYIALVYAKQLAKEYSLALLTEIADDIRSHKYSTQVSDLSKEIVRCHKIRFNTVKLKDVIIPVEIAIRNYDAYKQSDKEDAEYVAALEKKYDAAKAIYYKDYDAYEAERKKHVIPYHLMPVK